MLGYINAWTFLGLVTCIAAQSSDFRLPISLWPVHYAVNIDTDLDAGNFTGRTIIELTVANSVNRIVLHSKDLVISSLTLDGQTGTFYTYNTTTDFLIVQLSEYLTPNTNAVLRIEYSGTLGTENVGYYLASYQNEQNQIRRLAITHFESTNARRAFPCFDEPHLKATFQISLTRSNTHTTSSNMQLVQQFPSTNNRVTDVYAISEQMSTYLVAFMVSDFLNISSVVNSVSYRTFARPQEIVSGHADYSLAIAPQAIQAMESFTNVSYVLSTMDQVSVPNDYYKIGAMENWGMITFREKYLMYNATTTTAAEQQFITTLITHEFAHQWFGNLVTPDWWNYIWLNEGFATYFEMWTTAQFETNWNLMEQFVVEIVQRAFADDALQTTKPMSRPVNTPAEIEAIYDSVVYDKAGSVIRMAANFLGQAVFRDGLTEYLNHWRFLTVNPQRLYERWQTALNNPNLNVAEIMSSWEVQSGYPVVTVTRLSNSTIISQERFLINSAEHNDRTVWHIPLNWLTSTATTNTITWLTTSNMVINNNLNIPLTNWVIFNVNQAGFYRVNYDDENWQLLINQLRTGNFQNIPVINRAQLVGDSFELARSQRLNLSVALDIGSYIQNETAYVPIATFTKVFSHLERLATGMDHYKTIQIYGRTALEGYFNRTGFIQESDSHLTKLTKVTVLTWLCKLEHTGCRANSIQVFQRWITQNIEIQSDSQSFVFCNGIRNATVANWENALQRYVALREDTQRTRIAQGLGCSNNQQLLQRLLDLVIAANTVISLSDRAPAVTSVFTNNGLLGVNLVLQWLNRNFATITQRVGSLNNIINGVASRVTTNEQAALFATFVAANSPKFTTAINSTLAVASESIETNLVWINETLPQFEEYFDDRSGSNIIYCQIILIISCISIHFLYK